MEIVIHGVKDGRKIFSPVKSAALFNLTVDDSKACASGQKVYAIRFTADNIIFSKYKIICDVRGEKRTGFIAFSLFLPLNKKLTGKDIINLLEDVSSEYCRTHIADNNLNEVIKDWSFLEKIANEYEKKLQAVSNETAVNMNSDSKENAFVYFPYIYKDPDTLKETKYELHDIFDNPFQEEYNGFRQVLFIEKPTPKRRERYGISAGKHGKEIKNYYFTYREDGGDVKSMIKAKIGYKFSHFVLDRTIKTDEIEGTLIAQYVKEQSLFNYITSILLLLLIAGIIVLLFIFL